MKSNSLRKTSIGIVICLIVIGMVFVCHIINLGKMNVYAEEDNTKNDLMTLSGGGGRTDSIGIISGTDAPTLPFSDLTDVKYIPNSNYFLINPWHHDNDRSDNPGGTCTTVAVQMLLGYHNYFSDRRLLPTTGNGRVFLDATYGNISEHPAFKRTVMPTSGQGCKQIGTDEGVYQELFDLTWISSWKGIGQAIGLVKDGAIRFLNKYTPAEVKGEISISSGIFNASTARSDIDAGRPIIIGIQPIFTGADSFHVMIAYGYAKLDGVDGFLVHFGWGAQRTQVWIPQSWCAFQIRMSVAHTHTFVDTGVHVNGTHRELSCSTCNCHTVDRLYDLSDSTITGVRYPLSNSVAIPSSINLYSNATATFTNQPITDIGASAFSNQTKLTSLYIPGTITTIGANAFENCTGMTTVSLSNVESIGNNAFKGCNSLTSVTIPSSISSIGTDVFSGCTSLQRITVDAGNPNYSSQDGILYNKAKTELLYVPQAISGSVIIPNGVTTIGTGMFSNCVGLTKIILPSGLRTIGNSAISNCRRLTSIAIPSRVTTIGSMAFYKCTGFTRIILPSSVESIGENAFYYCDLEDVYVERTASQGITSLGSGAFAGCPQVSISVPDLASLMAYRKAWVQYESMITCEIHMAFITFTDPTYDREKNNLLYAGIEQFSLAEEIPLFIYCPDDTVAKIIDKAEIAIDEGAGIVFFSFDIYLSGHLTSVLDELCYTYPDILFFGHEDRAEANFISLKMAYETQINAFFSGYLLVQEGFTNIGIVGDENDVAARERVDMFLHGVEYAAWEMGLISHVITVRVHYTAYDYSPELESLMLSWFQDGTEVIQTISEGDYIYAICNAVDHDDKWICGYGSDILFETPRGKTSVIIRWDTFMSAALPNLFTGIYDEPFQQRLNKIFKDHIAINVSALSESAQIAYDVLYEKIESGQLILDCDLERIQEVINVIYVSHQY